MSASSSRAVVPGPLRTAKDFFHALFVESQAPHANFLAERERWLRSVQVEGREELLFEFEMLLRGVERYFNLHNLPIDRDAEPVVIRNFLPELQDVRDAIDQAIRIARRLLDPDSDQKMIFRHYVESSLADDRARRALLEEELDQGTPQEALFVLRQTFEALRSVIDALGRLDGVPYGLFNDIGNLALREIVLNRYFRPFRALEFRIEYDRIKSVPVLEALRKLSPDDRRLFTVAFLALFRVLHYLSYVTADDPKGPPRRARVILALTRSELSTLFKYLRRELGPRVTDKKLRGAALSTARAIHQGHERIVKEFLRSDDEPALADAAVAFTSILREQVAHLAHAIDAESGTQSVFAQLVLPTRMSERLRKDLHLFAALAQWASVQLTSNDPAQTEEALSALQAFIEYFHDVSYQLLRYGDYEAVDRFAAVALELDARDLGPAAAQRFANDCRLFAQVLDTMFAQVSRRAELRDRPFDPKATAEAVRVFTGS